MDVFAMLANAERRCTVIMKKGPRSGRPCNKIEGRHCPTPVGPDLPKPWTEPPHRYGCKSRAMVHHQFSDEEPRNG